jgi:hypothetical protein
MPLMGEIWKIVPSQPWCMASSDGRIMVAPYSAPMPKGGARQYGGEPSFGIWNKQDGRFITVYKGKTYKVHRLICEAFNGPAPEGADVCMHLDENSANNRPDNLAWGTQKENLNAPAFKAYCSERTGEDNPWVRGRLKASLS